MKTSTYKDIYMYNNNFIFFYIPGDFEIVF